MKKQSGFTFVELIAVMLIIGVLAAVTLPKLIDLRDNAVTASTLSLQGAIQTASVLNYDSRMLDNTLGSGNIGSTCNVAAAALLEKGLPQGYALGDANSIIVDGDNQCEIYYNGTDTTVAATIKGTAPVAPPSMSSAPSSGSSSAAPPLKQSLGSAFGA